jgi:hypothetical protein
MTATPQLRVRGTVLEPYRSHRRSASRLGLNWRLTVHVRFIGLSSQGDITLEN